MGQLDQYPLRIQRKEGHIEITDEEVLAEEKQLAMETQDARIIALANELMRELIKLGYKQQSPVINDRYLSVDIVIYDDDIIHVRNIMNDWDIKGTYDADK